VKAASALLLVLSLQVLLVLLILKVDGFTVVGGWEMRKIVLGPCILSSVLVVAWLLADYMVMGDRQSQLINSLPYAAEAFYEVDVKGIETYYETLVFRDLLLLICYLGLAASGVMIYMTPCSGCNTPYPLFGMGIAITYALRAMLRFVYISVSFSTAFRLTKELWAFQLDQKDRFNSNSVTQYYQRSICMRISTTIDSFLFFMTLTLCLLTMFWIVSNSCAVRCAKLVDSCAYILMGCFALEICFTLSVLLVRFFYRRTRLEMVINVFKRIGGMQHMESIIGD